MAQEWFRIPKHLNSTIHTCQQQLQIGTRARSDLRSYHPVMNLMPSSISKAAASIPFSGNSLARKCFPSAVFHPSLKFFLITNQRGHRGGGVTGGNKFTWQAVATHVLILFFLPMMR